MEQLHLNFEESVSEFSEQIDYLQKTVKNLLLEKRRMYGDTYAIVPKILKLFLSEKKDKNENFVLTEKDIDKLLAIVRIFDKLYRVMNIDSTKEDVESAWLDILGYSILEELKNK